MLRAFEGEKVRHFMKQRPVTVTPSISIKELIEDYIYKYHYKMFPVVKNGKLAGCISTQEIREVPSKEWDQRKVSDILKECSAENTLRADTDVIKALSIMNQTGKSRMMVAEGGRLIGVITLKDLLKFLSLKLDLEGEES